MIEPLVLEPTRTTIMMMIKEVKKVFSFCNNIYYILFPLNLLKKKGVLLNCFKNKKAKR